MKATADAVLEQLFDDESHPLYAPYARWVRHAKRFRGFSIENASKIRAKLRNTVDPANLQDLLFELETAVWFLNDKRFSLAYEEHGVRKRRGPDFVVTFTTKLSFGVEVTRLQFSRLPDEEESDMERQFWRIGNIISGKLAQTNLDMGNLLVIGVAAEQVPPIDLDALMRQFRQRAQEKDETLLSRSRLSSASEFFKHYYRVSGLMLRALSDSTIAPSPVVWNNPEGRFPLPAPILTALQTNSPEFLC